MTEKLDVEFTDRYDGRKPPWNYCRGGCEATGVIPVKVPVQLGIDPAGEPGEAIAICEGGHLLDLARTDHERGVGHEGNRCDGWHFVSCPDCGGSGEIAWWRALRFLPGKGLRTLRFIWDHGLHSYSRPAWMTWREQLVMVLRIAVGKSARRGRP